MDNLFNGLISGKQFHDGSWNTRSNRRKIFHDFPGGQFPLTGLLSILEPDWTDSPEYGWHEKPWYDPSTTVAAGSTVPFTASGGTVSLGAEVDFTEGLVFRLHVDDKTQIREGQVIMLGALPITGDATGDLTLFVESVVAASDALEVRVLEALANVINTTDAIDDVTAGPVNAPISIIGNANAEGSNSRPGIFVKPFLQQQFTQIFKNSFSVTGTAAVVPTDWDGRGTYPELSQDNLTQHMVQMERAFFWSKRSYSTVIDDGEEVPLRTMGGLIWFLEQYEAADSPYRGGTGAAALTSINDDDKRIIKPTNNTMTFAFFSETLMERLFRVVSNKGYEKICMCGNGFLGVLNAYLRANTETTRAYKSETSIGWNVYTVEFPWGTVHFKTHPLFNRDPNRRYDAWFLDIGGLVYRPLRGRDTMKLKNQQKNGYDKRKDLWLTETSLEVRLPQSNMYIRNLRSLT